MVIPVTRITLFRKSQLTKYFGYSSHQLCLHFTHNHQTHQPIQNDSQNENLPFTIQLNSKVGYQWIATQPLKAGMVLLDEMPTWTGPRAAKGSDTMTNCVTCGDDLRSKLKKWTELFRRKNRCTNCGWPVCGSDCEKSSIHADHECQIFKTLQIKFPPDKFKMSEVGSFIGLLRGVNMKNTMPAVYEELMKLQDELTLPHLSEKQNEITKFRVDSLERFLKKSLDNKDEYEKFHRLSIINSFNSYNTSNNCGRNLLYPKISRMNHACTPNCTHDIGPGPSFQMRVRAAIDIKVGTELTICYDSSNFQKGTLERQKSFRSVGGLGFVCGCSRCLDPKEDGSMLSGITCKACFEKNTANGITDPNKFGYFLPKDPLCIDDNAEWKCSGCGDKVPASTILPIVDELNESIEKQQNEEEYYFDYLFKKYGNGHVLHPNHYILQKAASRLAQSYEENITDLDENQFESLVRLYLYQLGIRNRIAPGSNRERGILVMNAIKAVLRKMAVKCRSGKSNFEEDMNLCISLESEARLCFRNALNYEMDGKEHSYLDEIEALGNRRRQLERVFTSEFRKMIRLEK